MCPKFVLSSYNLFIVSRKLRWHRKPQGQWRKFLKPRPFINFSLCLFGKDFLVSSSGSCSDKYFSLLSRLSVVLYRKSGHPFFKVSQVSKIISCFSFFHLFSAIFWNIIVSGKEERRCCLKQCQLSSQI